MSRQLPRSPLPVSRKYGGPGCASLLACPNGGRVPPGTRGCGCQQLSELWLYGVASGNGTGGMWHGPAPALGLHHGSRVNPFALVDDLMEPFRPLVDTIARDLAEADGAQIANLDPDRKRRLASVLQQDLITKIGSSPLINCLGRLAQSLATSLAAKKDLLDLAQIVPSNRLL